MSLFLKDLLFKRSVETASELIQAPERDFVNTDIKQLRPDVGLVECQLPGRLPSHLGETRLHVDAVVGGDVLFEDRLVDRVEDNLVFDLIRVLTQIERSVHVAYGRLMVEIVFRAELSEYGQPVWEVSCFDQWSNV